MIHGDSKINKVTSLERASYAQVVNATATVVTAAANTKGVLIKFLSTGGFGYSYRIKIGADEFYRSADDKSTVFRDIYVPPGKDIILSGTGDSSYLTMVYEVLV